MSNSIELLRSNYIFISHTVNIEFEACNTAVYYIQPCSAVQNNIVAICDIFHLINRRVRTYPTSQGVGVYSYQDTAGNSFPKLRNRLLTRRLRPSRLRLPQFTGSPFFGPGKFRANMDNNAHQSAFASAVVAPGYRRQIAAIDPINPGLPNVDVTSRAAETDSSNPNFVSVSSSSYASSANIDGKVSGMRGSETVVNENGKVTKYEVHS
ncbi:uncharacterized protein LOC125077996 isoform X4 [Vanessa atalanta]|uniref:uncharacterized protein LOC125077996 isoform X4 n=1 Tax=Vanessa atalanta TaxID=42275 RepID=UPI001FCD4AE7|nr:uncharacterized protein LOC125077996 isoform X4 [Vanessa atalanta]